MNLKTLVTKQKMMRIVLLALLPVALMSVYLFGWRHMVMGLVVALAGAIAEYLVMRTINKEKTKVSEAVFVTAALLTLSLPPETPMWIAVVGMVFGIVFGKAAFGGYGRNIFNPALVGRCFIYIAFPAQMTMQWAQPYMGLPGGFARWLPQAAADVTASVTPIISLGSGSPAASYGNLFLGTVAGSLGETSALLILLGGVYLVYKKVASWQIMVSTIGSAGILSAALYLFKVTAVDPLFTLLSGGLMFGAIFMATDPVSAPRDKTTQWLYGVLIGVITVIIRTFSLFTEGMMFAILIVNALTPLMEMQVKQWKAKTARKEATA